jgi:hypothetical protein
MTRARCYALALVVGVCCLGSTQAFAQYEPAPQPAPVPGDPSQPFETPAPICPDPWYGTADDVEPSINVFGPQVRVNSWFLRAEYLNWNARLPKNVLLGAPVFGDHVVSPDKPFLIFAPNGNTVLGYGYVPNLNGVNLNDNSGVRVTAGVDLIDGGQFEVSAFMLAKKQSGYTIPLSDFGLFDPSVLLFQQYGIGTGVPGSQALVPFVAATSTLVNGSDASSHLFLYNTSFQAIYISQLWGGEANFLMDGNPSEFLQWQPLIGARYLNLTEHMNINGVFIDQFNPGPPLTTMIQSSAINNIWGGQIGLRAHVDTKWLEFGATGKILFLGDTAASTVIANNFTFPNNGYAAFTDVTTKFTFGSEADAFVNINLTPSFTVRTGYTALWVNHTSRPFKNVYYNDAGQAGPPIALQTVFHDFFVHGFSFGCEFRF